MVENEPERMKLVFEEALLEKLMDIFNGCLSLFCFTKEVDISLGNEFDWQTIWKEIKLKEMVPKQNRLLEFEFFDLIDVFPNFMIIG